MARIAIFCDGTWNSPTMKQPTHVVRLFEHTRRTTPSTPIILRVSAQGAAKLTSLPEH